MYLKETKKWIENKPKSKYLGLLSAFLALIPDQIYGTFAHIFAGTEYASDFKVENPQEWLKLYKRHRQIYKACFGEMDSNFAEGFEHQDFLNSLFSIIVKSYLYHKDIQADFEGMQADFDFEKECEEERIIQIVESLWDYLFERLDNYAKQLSDNHSSLNNSESAESTGFPQEINFLLRIWLASWFINGEAITPLLRRARQGRDLDAIKKVLLIDKNAINEPGIFKLWSKYSQDPECYEYEQIHKALAQQPKVIKYDMKKAKYATAGLIAHISDDFTSPLNPSQIGQLFNCLAKDLAPQGKIVHKDPDLPNFKSDAFRKAVKREKEHWKNFTPIF